MSDRNTGVEPMACLSDDRLLEGAKIIYRYRGMLPLHLVAALLARGYDVSRLETKWDHVSYDDGHNFLGEH